MSGFPKRLVGHPTNIRMRTNNETLTFLSALELAEEYGIVPWIEALLDETTVVAADDEKVISPPPKFTFMANQDRTSLAPPSGTPARGRGRPRASSPVKSISGNKHLTPRKPRTTKASKEANATSAREVSASLQATLDSAASIADTESIDGEKVNGEKHDEEKEEKSEGDKVTVQVDSTVEVHGDTEVTNTKVRVEMPFGSPELPLPDNTEDMITRAKEMVEEARKLDGESARITKRKAEELDDEEDEELDTVLQPAKKARLLEQELKKQRVRKRALIGVATTLAIGYVLGSTGSTNGPLLMRLQCRRALPDRRMIRLQYMAHSVVGFHPRHPLGSSSTYPLSFNTRPMFVQCDFQVEQEFEAVYTWYMHWHEPWLLAGWTAWPHGAVSLGRRLA